MPHVVEVDLRYWSVGVRTSEQDSEQDSEQARNQQALVHYAVYRPTGPYWSLLAYRSPPPLPTVIRTAPHSSDSYSHTLTDHTLPPVLAEHPQRKVGR